MACKRLEREDSEVYCEIQKHFGVWGIRSWVESEGLEACIFVEFDIKDLKNAIKELEETKAWLLQE